MVLEQGLQPPKLVDAHVARQSLKARVTLLARLLPADLSDERNPVDVCLLACIGMCGQARVKLDSC